MAYTSNPNMPHIRREAAALVAKGWSARKVGRYFGFHHTAVMKWVARAKKIGYHPIPTRSSKPKSHPRRLDPTIEERIVAIRSAHRRYGAAIHQQLLNEGMHVSLSSVNRVLDRHHLLKKKSPWKRFHPHLERPVVAQRGDLVEVDTIHRMVSTQKRLYVFALVDVYSRSAYAKAYAQMNAATALAFVQEAERKLGFPFKTIQTDRGPEFGRWFVSQSKKRHRYTRIGKPNDNAHIERFNRTVQEECLDHAPNNVEEINRALKRYLRYYSNERLHAGINFLTPMQVV